MCTMPQEVVGDHGLGSRWRQGAVQNPTKLVRNITKNRSKANFLAAFGRENGFDIIGVPKESAYLWEMKLHHCGRSQSSGCERKQDTEYRKSFQSGDRGEARGLCDLLAGERSQTLLKFAV